MDIFQELEIEEYKQARTLFKGFDYQVVVRAVIERTSPGKIWVDDPVQPNCGFMATTEGWFLAGDPNNNAFNLGLRRLVHDMILKGKFYSSTDPELLDCLYFDIDSDKWTATFPVIFDIRPPLPVHRIHFSCSETKLDWKDKIPEDYRLLRVDSTLDIDSLEFPDDIKEWVESTLDIQMEMGFGSCLVEENKVVVWINSDGASGEECEIGIITTKNYRLRGLGALTATATVDYCLSIGFKSVGWHCEDNNHGSIAVAQKVGFVKERDYVSYICMFSESEHYANMGMRHFFNKEYENAINDFESAFKIGEVPIWAYILAARAYATKNEVELVVKYLERAHSNGWENWKLALNREEFLPLHDRDEIKKFMKQVL
jgi:RimJ/RimL family protein N-acetyltransferase